MESSSVGLVLALLVICACNSDVEPATSSIDAALNEDSGPGDNRGGTAGTAAGGSGGTSRQGGSSGGSAGSDAGALNGGNAGLPVFQVPQSYQWSKTKTDLLLYGFWGTDESNVYGVGAGGVLHFQNGMWRSEPSMAGATLTGVWGSGRDDVYAAVESNVVLRRKADGKWTKQVLAQYAGRRFSAVWGSGPNDVYIVGSGILHSKGDDKWVDEDDGTIAFQSAIGGYDATHVYVGNSAGQLFFSKGDGVWRQQSIDKAADIYSIWVRAPDDVYVLGATALYHGRGDGEFRLLATSDSPLGGFNAMWSSGDGSLFASSHGGLHYLDSSAGKLVKLTDEPATALWGYGKNFLVYGNISINVGVR